MITLDELIEDLPIIYCENNKEKNENLIKLNGHLIVMERKHVFDVQNLSVLEVENGKYFYDFEIPLNQDFIDNLSCSQEFDILFNDEIIEEQKNIDCILVDLCRETRIKIRVYLPKINLPSNFWIKYNSYHISNKYLKCSFKKREILCNTLMFKNGVVINLKEKIS